MARSSALRTTSLCARKTSARQTSARAAARSNSKKKATSAKKTKATKSTKGKIIPVSAGRTKKKKKRSTATKLTAAKRESAPVVVEEPQRPTLSMDDDLTRIWVTYKRTNDVNLRNILIEIHVPLIRMIAERLLQTLPKSIELEDLTSAGTFGLMDAINGFDLSRGIKFKTYCTTRIRGSILDELRSQDWVPRLVRLKAHRLEKAIRLLEGELGRDPNQFELAEAMEMSLDELQSTRSEANAKTIFSLSEKWDDSDDDNEMEKVEILADKKCTDPVQTMHQKDVLELITANLTKKERLIIIMYYYEGLTMREIGEIMELTESRVCQIHSNVMSRLKAQLNRVNLQVR